MSGKNASACIKLLERQLTGGFTISSSCLSRFQCFEKFQRLVPSIKKIVLLPIHSNMLGKYFNCKHFQKFKTSYAVR